VTDVVLSEQGGSVSVTAGALSKIVVQAAESVEGARVRRPRRPGRHLDVAVDGSRARVELGLAVRLGAVLPEVARDVQERVADALQTMCGFEVQAVDVTVEDVSS
jgi:uncharacterized alkaline shock family protein YloU